MAVDLSSFHNTKIQVSPHDALLNSIIKEIEYRGMCRQIKEEEAEGELLEIGCSLPDYMLLESIIQEDC